MVMRVVRVLGVIFIVLFSAFSVFISLSLREIDEMDNPDKFKYTSYFEDRFYDIRMNLNRDPKAFFNNVVLVKIDEYSLEHTGRFPFTRTWWAKFMDKMTTFGSKVVAFDVFFVEPETACPGVDSPDQIFRDAIVRYQQSGNRKVILPYSMNVDARGKTNRDFDEVPEVLYNYILSANVQGPGADLRAQLVSKDAFPHPIFHDTEAPMGHIEAIPDADGVMRHYQTVSNVETLYFGSFSLATSMAYTGDTPKLVVPGSGVESYIEYANGKKQGVNSKGESKVRWLGASEAFPSVSLWDIINAKDDDPDMKLIFENAAVFVGSTAFGAHDLRHTPVDHQLPGVYFHMNMFLNMMQGAFLKSVAESTMVSWVMLLGGTLVMVLIQLFGKPVLDLIVVTLLLGGLFSLDLYFLLPQGYEVKLFFCLFSILACYSWNTFLNFYLSNKDKAFLKNAFGNYISPELIDEMYQSGEPPKLGGNEGVITAYFTDIASFSTFSEKLSATKLVELLNEYLTAMTDILLEERGTLDKYEGDAIIAFFGAPMKLTDHAQRACRVACRMQYTLLDLRKKWTSEGEKWPKIVHEMRMRIGINSGSIVTGNMGSTQRMNYTMMGDSVNLAARLEEAAKQYGIYTQISSFTKDLIVDESEFLIREIDNLRVVGKSEPVTTYEIVGLADKATDVEKKLAPLFNQGRQLYRTQKWDEAIAVFKETLELEYLRYPELKGKKTNPSEIYLKRCEEFKEVPPPPNWDGVYTLTEK
jgi:adenylate cyclase